MKLPFSTSRMTALSRFFARASSDAASSTAFSWFPSCAVMGSKQARSVRRLSALRVREDRGLALRQKIPVRHKVMPVALSFMLDERNSYRLPFERFFQLIAAAPIKPASAPSSAWRIGKFRETSDQMCLRVEATNESQ